MKRFIAIVVLLFSFLHGHGQIERDKVLHFAGGSLFGLAGAGIAKQVSDGNRYWTFAGAVGGSLLVGLGKEAIDAGQEDNGWDNDDLLATVLGGVTVGVVIDIFTDHKRKKNRKGNLATHQYKSLNLDAALNFEVTDGIPPSLNYLSIPKSIIQ